MTRIQTLFRSAPIEVFVLGVPSVLLIIWSIIYKLYILPNPEPVAVVSTFAVQSIGGAWFWMAFLAVICWLFISSGQIIGNYLRLHDRDPTRFDFSKLWVQIKKLWGSTWFILAMTAIPSIAVALSIGVLFHTASATSTMYFSNALSEWEYRIFGAYPHFAIIHFFAQFPSLDFFIVNGYNGLFICVSFTFLLTFATSTEAFRKFVLAFFLNYWIAFPIWFALPLVAPFELHLDNVFHETQSEAVVAAVAGYNATPLQPTSVEYRGKLEKMWIDPKGEWLAVSSLPSMHAAWATITIATLFSIDVLLGLAFLPAFLLCMIGTVYTLNHYVTDIGVGCIVGIFAMLVARRLLAFEKTYRKSNSTFFFAAEMMQGDVQELWNKVRRKVWM